MPGAVELLRDQPAQESVITEAIIRDCIQVTNAQAATAADKRMAMSYKSIEHLAFSFCNIRVIENLAGLVTLTKLQLDNNCITRIQNLDHLVNLTWLDLSFNAISKIEGLDKLTKLTDLSLFCNHIDKIENLQTLTNLSVLSIGRNQISKFDNVTYLRQFKHMRMVNLAGNPLSSDPEYRSYVLSHIRDLTYLDYRRVNPADVAAAMEQHQDEMNELVEREEQEAVTEKAAAEAAAHLALMQEANLEGVETMLDDMVRADADWPRLQQVPNLTDGWPDVKDKFGIAMEEFKNLMLEQHGKKKNELADFERAVAALLSQCDAQSREAVVVFQKQKKHTFRAVRENPAEAERQLAEPLEQLETLEDALLALEMDNAEHLQGLLQEFDSNYSEIAETDKGYYNTYFTQASLSVRDLDNRFYENLGIVATTALEKFNQEADVADTLPEEARLLLGDKDVFLNAIQASHDVHASQLDGLEDRLVSQELRGANELVSSRRLWAERRNRDRVAEIMGLIDRTKQEVESLLQEIDDLS
eukprot:jgi/Astpho2/4982/e_gw1.00070.8.1_t